MSLPEKKHLYIGLLSAIFTCFLLQNVAEAQLDEDTGRPIDTGDQFQGMGPLSGSTACENDEVACKTALNIDNSTKCILRDWMCDEDDDCGDGSDEELTACLLMRCSEDQFNCLSNRGNRTLPVCIYKEWVCDGTEDCLMGEDELQPQCERPAVTVTGRPDVTSPAPCVDQFQCPSGKCIPNEHVCDHYVDCWPERTDEANCNYTPCTENQFQCVERQNCIEKSLICTDTWDCGDGSDEAEELCNPTSAPTCAPGYFTCLNGQCIQFDFVCNGFEDCDDGSDEFDCNVNECTVDGGSKNTCTDPSTCRNTQTSFKCVCEAGYKLEADGVTCIEIDECAPIFPQTCAQTCLNRVGSFTCGCNNRFDLVNGTQCSYSDKSAVPYVLYANRFFINKMALDGTNTTTISADHALAHVFDFDYAANMIYFADKEDRKIGTMNFDGSNKKHLYNDWYGATEGIAVDWVSKKIYWTERPGTEQNRIGPRAIKVSEMNGTNIRTLFNDTHTDNPRGIVVHPGKGLFYWTDWRTQPYVASAHMDGSNFKEIITKGIYWPNAITIDYYTNRLYIADARIDNIMVTDLEGNVRASILSSLAHVYSVNIFEQWIFWADWNTLSIERANRFTGKDRSVIEKLSLRPYDIHIYHPSRQPSYPNPCGVNNGGCSHLCLLAPDGSGTKAVCSCPDHFIMSDDGMTCRTGCNDAQFLCGPTDSKCIPFTWECDGDLDCKGGEDEATELCADRECNPGMFQCKNYTFQSDCVNLLYRCDGDNDCRDASDEEMCDSRVCIPGQFRCDSGQCISRSWTCDGDRDCNDGSDEAEELCKDAPCAPNQFRCNNTNCISNTFVCDFDDDCGDGSDEPRDECSNRPCPAGWFRCASNYRCVKEFSRCDGNNDCRDNSDEIAENCNKCEFGQFTCKNGNCIAARWRCDFFDHCGDGSDEDKRCEDENLYRDCFDNEFMCKNKRCISKDRRCDMKNECPDGEDEENCSDHMCPDPDTQNQCTSGHCYLKRYQCDGDKDCTDASDEQGCEPRYPNGRYCADDKFQCGNTVCVSLSYRCDGDDDCGDGSDEADEQCDLIDCTSQYRFRCKNKKCIYSFERCDGVDDCGDGSDENDLQVCVGHMPRACTLNEFRCANHECLEAEKVCDGAVQCGKLANGSLDASDELGCFKNSSGCRENNGDCVQTCTPINANADESQQGHYCSCRPGFMVDPYNTRTCIDINECESWGNNCTQRCVNEKPSLVGGRGYTCQCWDGFTTSHAFNRDQHVQCFPTEGPPETILMAIAQSVRQLRPRSNPIVNEDAVINGARIKAIDVDTVHGLVYWTDPIQQKIYRAALPTGTGHIADPQDLELDLGLGANEDSEPDGITYDWVARNIYWSDVKQGNIKVATENGTYVKTIVSSQGGPKRSPVSLAINPARGLLYWVDDKSAKIEMSYMDGTNIISFSGANLQEPTGLAIDYWQNGRLYWCDMKRNAIYSAEWDGSDVRMVIHKGLNNPYSLDVYGSDLFWVSMTSSELRKQDKFGRGVNATVQTGLYNVKDIKVSQKQRYNTSIPNPCLRMRCFPLCLLVPGDTEYQPKGVCACPDGYDFLTPGSGTNCRVPVEAGFPYPDVCGCLNDGQCIRDRMTEAPMCVCRGGFRGKKCEMLNVLTFPPVIPGGTGAQGPPTRRTPGPLPRTTPTPQPQDNSQKSTQDSGSGSVVVVVVVIVVIFLVLLAVILVVIYLYRSGRLTRNKTGRGEFRAGSNATNGGVTPEPVYDYPQGVAPGEEVTVNPQDNSAQFVNPLYYTKNGEATGNAEGEYAQIDPGPLPTKAPIDDTRA